jgi:type II secretory pathway component PulJ
MAKHARKMISPQVSLGKATSSKIPPEANGGFSLVDMLVALLLLAIISGLMATFIGQFRVINRLQDSASIQIELNALAGYLEDSISRAMPLPLTGNRERRQFLLGTENSIRYVEVARRGLRSFGLTEAVLSLKNVVEPHRITLVQQHHPRRLGTTAADQIELAEGVVSLKFKYLSYDTTTRSAAWLDEWSTTGTLPVAVRFDLVVDRAGKSFATAGYAVLSLARRGEITPAVAP